MHALSRDAILNRYRRYRDIRMDIQTMAFENIPHSSFLAYAKRISPSDGKVLFTTEISRDNKPNMSLSVMGLLNRHSSASFPCASTAQIPRLSNS
jgi:hypothetical protein